MRNFRYCQPLSFTVEHIGTHIVNGATLAVLPTVLKRFALMARSRLIKRMAALRNWEAFNVVFFMTLLVRWVRAKQPPETWYLTAYSVFLVCYILVQGSLYWHLKMRSLRQRYRTLPIYFSFLFAWLHRSTYVMLLLFPVITFVSWSTQQISTVELLRSSAIASFALLEYINYYHYQIKHDTVNDLRYLLRYKRFRKAPLAVDRIVARSRIL